MLVASVELDHPEKSRRVAAFGEASYIKDRMIGVNGARCEVKAAAAYLDLVGEPVP